MASFPALKTCAIAQYPATKAIRFQNQGLRFLDGTEQRYRDAPGALHRWQVRLELLDEPELARLEEFFVEMRGRSGSFAFTDPWDGTLYGDCSFESDAITAESISELRGRTNLTIVENRT